ncbi:FAD-dependent oxidoreductase [Lacticaseibacillus jixiensis]|uniref:FAD-dependent oxidoreductase n=1 Tax=Lacticaseibacillus jixiensis TaxID=3231926 RepID=UPI0036F2FDA9
MVKKIIVVGGNAGGASAAARVRRLDERASITIFEKGPAISYSNCSLPYHLDGTIKDANSIVLLTPAELKAQYNITAHINNEVIAVDSHAQIVTVRNTRTGKQTTHAYDDLVLAPGATPVIPTLPGADRDHVFAVRDVADIDRLAKYLHANAVRHIAVIGAGFVGLELTEHLVNADYQVSLIEAKAHILANFDDDFVQVLHKELIDHGVDLHTATAVAQIGAHNVTLADQTTLPAETVIFAVGVQPNTALAQKIGITLGETGAIAVDRHYATNLPHIYAIGDAIEVTNTITHQQTRQNLAYQAQLQARIAADHIYGRNSVPISTQGSQVLPLFTLNAAATGLSEAAAKAAGIQTRIAEIIPKDKVPLMPNAKPLRLKVVFRYPDGALLGAQAIGASQVDKQIDIIATAIHFHGTVADLPALDLAYQPQFATAKNAVQTVGLVASNILNDEYKQVPVSAVRELVESGATIIDTREPDEYAQGHIHNAINIPLSQFRKRLAEIPTDQPVYLHCLSSQRSYNVVRALVNLGYTNVYNIVGSFLGLSEYEYYHDQTSGRKPIIDHYRFDLL